RLPGWAEDVPQTLLERSGHGAPRPPPAPEVVQVGPMKSIELRRHADRAKDADALSREGRVQAEDVGRTLPSDYAFIYVSAAKRTAETVAWFLRASTQALPP